MTPLPAGHLAGGEAPRPARNWPVKSKMPGACRASPQRFKRPRSLDLGFAEFDVLLGDGIVFLLHQLVGHGARILARYIIEAGVGAGDQLDLDIGGFGHGRTSVRVLADNLVAKRAMSRKP